ncbi:MAG: peptidoglycan-binding protein, partial [Candidatus Omnitrophica bacterium]|nr:peptidoglycan-binding protein [Candidatus Omnitrophota bacterium]MCG2704986.1 peptidoglycan-binding protein [Candidatus Omnitrophota bacterium]
EAKEEKIILGPEELQKNRIQTAQNSLEKKGFDVGSLDGKMGWRTRDAIKEFQKAKGLKVSGFLDTKTWSELNQPVKKDKIKSSSKQLKNVKEIQLALKKAGFNPGPIDGKTGSRTKRAIIEFQKSKNLAANGVLNDETAKELEKYIME